MIKKIISRAVLVLTLIQISQVGFASQEDIDFNDLENHWSRENVERLVSKGIINGYEDGAFKPDNEISVAEFLKLLMTNNKIALGEKGDAWYEEYVNGASDIFIIKEDEFSDYKMPINRGQMALMISRSLDLNELSSNKFNDEGNFSKYKDAIYKVAHVGIINGYEDNTFRALNSATRAEASAMISRIDVYLNSNNIEVVDNTEVVEEEVANNIIDSIWTEEEFVEFMNEEIVTKEEVEFFEGVFTTFESVETPSSDHAGFSLDEKNEIRYNDIGPNVHNYDFENYEESKWVKPLAHDLLKGLTYYAEKNGHYVDLDSRNDFDVDFIQIRYLAHPSDKIGGGGIFRIELMKENFKEFGTESFDMNISINRLSSMRNVHNPDFVDYETYKERLGTENYTFSEYLEPLRFTFERIFGEKDGLKFYNYVVDEYRIKAADIERGTYRDENYFFNIGDHRIEQDDVIDSVGKTLRFTDYSLDYSK